MISQIVARKGSKPAVLCQSHTPHFDQTVWLCTAAGVRQLAQLVPVIALQSADQLHQWLITNCTQRVEGLYCTQRVEGLYCTQRVEGLYFVSRTEYGCGSC